MNTDKFVRTAQADLDHIDIDLLVLESQADHSGDKWSIDQAQKLRADLDAVRRAISTLGEAHGADEESRSSQTKADAERHWLALKAAVKTYRDHVGRDHDRSS